MQRIKVVQQGTDLSALGGLTTEFKALEQSGLTDRYEFVPMVLPKVHRKVNFQDIRFYYQVLKKERPDIVQIRGAAVDGLNAQIAARLVPGTKILLCIHGMFSELVYMHPVKRLLHRHLVEPVIFRLSDGICSLYRRGDGRPQLEGFRDKLLPYIYNRMPQAPTQAQLQRAAELRQELGLPEKAVVGIFCGRINREKGLDYLLKALETLDRTRRWPENFHMLLLGDGDYLEALRSGIRHSGLEDRVRCLGTQREVMPYLLASDFFVMPSLHENHSIALLEALAAQLPMIATDVGGNGEIVRSGMEGMLCPPGDEEALADCILAMAGEKKRREQYRKHIQSSSYPQFSNEAVDARLESAYQTLLER